MGLCVVSQRPAKVDKNIISQCNTNIILKVTNPNDLKAIIQSVEGLTNQTYREIQRLPIGIALISGGSLQMPVMAEIRTRETSHGGRSVRISKDSGDDLQPELEIPMPQLETPPPPTNRSEVKSYTPAEPVQTPPQTTKKEPVTEKAKHVTRVAYRLGWVSTDDPSEAIEILTKEAEKMNENVYKLSLIHI